MSRHHHHYPSPEHAQQVGRQAIELVMAQRIGAVEVGGAVLSEIRDPIGVIMALAAMVNLLADDDDMTAIGMAEFTLIDPQED